MDRGSGIVQGRELLSSHLPLYGRGTWLIRRVLVHPSFRRFLSYWKLWVATGLLAAFVKRTIAARAAKLSKAAAASRSVVDSKSKPPPCTGKKASFYQLLLPENGEKGLIVGTPEIGVLVAASLTNAWLMLYKAWLMREFVTGQNLGLWRRWLTALAKFPIATMLSAFLAQVTQYTQARVSLLWRRASTQRLLRDYFSSMNYYKLLQHGTLRIDDPDVRMSSDIQAACDALTQVFMTGLSGFTMSLFSSWALYKRRGLYAVPLPYVYSLVMLPLTFSLAAPDWSVMGLVQKAKGAYQQCLVRCQLHSEGIAMLRGENFERAVLDRQASAWIDAESRSWVTMYRFEWVHHIFANPTMPGIWQTVASFGAAFLALRPANDGEALEALEPNEAVVYEYAENISDFWQVFYAVRGAGMWLQSLDNYKRTSASISRIEQLQSCLDELSKEASADAATMFSHSPAISFEDVSVKTPKGEQLVAGLTFKVEPGQHLVICGHNGAGKSSIFRCLGGLWPVASGRIAYPRDGAGSGGLHGAAYYLPQKPANILGTLSDQLTYPLRVGLNETQLRRWLGYVKLEHLVDLALSSPGGLSEELDWATQLSLGEQQCLGIARVLYHRPQFAILDECTSAVSKDMEKWLFEVARELGISCVTITHRPALQEEHHKMLKLTGTLSQDGRGWTLDDLPSDLPPTRSLVASEEDVHNRLSALGQRSSSVYGGALSPTSPGKRLRNVAARSEKHKAPPQQITTPAQRARQRWPTALQRIAAALRIDLIDTPTRMRCLLLVVCVLCRAQFNWEVYRTVAGSVTRTMCNDGPGLYAELIANLLYASGLTTLDRFLDNLGRGLSVDIWKRLANVLHEQALDRGVFHRMQSEDQHKVENPMQRIMEIKELLADVKGQVMTTGSQVWQMLYSLPMFIRGGGIAPAFTLIGLYGIHYVVRNRWMPNFKAITSKYTSYEANFQVAQTRVRHVAEPVAFSGGGELERLRIEEHFQRLCEHRLSSLGQEFLYNFLTAFFIQYDSLPMWFHRLLSFNFAWRNVPIGGASPASAVQNYLYDRTISVNLAGVQSLAAFSAEWGKMDGRATRILELYEALDTLQKEPQVMSSIADSNADILVVKNLDLVTPKSECLVADLSFSVEVGSPLLITGPNGSGKTSLARVLLGLWPSVGDAKKDVKIAMPESLTMVTQKPYLAPGSLGDQVSYPKKFEPRCDEERAVAALRATGIHYLFERAGEAGWSYRCTWEEVLSGGEQQRMCLARAFFHKPKFALLDECTSMVAADAEEGLYSTAIREFGITPLTFSQRLFLPSWHKNELHLGDNNEAGWSTSQIVASG